jgi:hypothetical protein
MDNFLYTDDMLGKVDLFILDLRSHEGCLLSGLTAGAEIDDKLLSLIPRGAERTC